MAAPILGAIGSYFGPIGYLVGSVIGSYIDAQFADPIRGPRLSDGTRQTSGVGMPIPFGYGTFITAGNIIWCGRVKEFVERNNHTFTPDEVRYFYRRSYAIGVCEGPIAGYLQIRRNGKLVYTTEPDATPAELEATAAFLEMATLYLGTDTQMPDPTIEAVEDVGNVSPFRNLAYIVVELDDLTDLGGAVPQYEFVVNATLPEAYFTSKPYPVLQEDTLSLRAMPVSGVLDIVTEEGFADDDAQLDFRPIIGSLSEFGTEQISVSGDAMALALEPQEGTLRIALLSTDMDGDQLGIDSAPLSGELRSVLISTDMDDQIGISSEPIGGTLT